jgi:diketogulonate reductase-like aldo/keto reductase
LYYTKKEGLSIMKQSRNLFFKIFIGIFLVTSYAQAAMHPTIEPDLIHLSSEEAYNVIKSVLEIGYHRFDFSSIGNHSNIIKQAIQECNADILISCAKLKDLSALNGLSNRPVGIVWSEVGIGKAKLKKLQKEKLVVTQGVAQSLIDPQFFAYSAYLPFKFIMLGNQINLESLFRQVVTLESLSSKKKITPFISLPIEDHCYLNVDSGFLNIAQRLNCKPYQVIFSLLKQMGIFVIPLVSKPMTQELHAEIMQAFSLRFVGKDWKSITHLLLPRARL